MSRAAPWLDRACDAVPVRLATALHDERDGHRPEMRATSVLPTTLRRRAPTTRSVIREVCLLAELLRMHGAFHDAPRTSDAIDSGFSRRAFSSRDVDRLPSSDAPVTALRLSSCSHCACARGFRLREETPLPCCGIARRVCERAAEITRSRPPVTAAASTDDPERLPSDGRALAPRGFPLAAFRFGTPPRFPAAARVHDDATVRPTSANSKQA